MTHRPDAETPHLDPHAITRPARMPLPIALALVLLLSAGLAHAVDGVHEISQAQALAGGVTPGDAAGFPVTLSQPGSYRLTSNLVVSSASANGIEVTSDDVSIDLNGFALQGPVVCTGTGTGVSCGAGSGVGIDTNLNHDGTVVRNGTITGFGGGGMVLGSLNPGFGAENRVENVRVARNGGDGLRGGLETVVVGVQAIANDGDGIDVSQKSLVQDSLASGNAAVGIDTGVASVVKGCTASDNGTDGVELSAGGAVFDSVARDNGEIGIDAASHAIVRGNVASENGTVQLDHFSGGYSGNVLATSPFVTGSAVNAGGNVCGGALCP